MEKKEKLEIIEVIHNVLVIYKNGKYEYIDAIYCVNEGVVTGRIVHNDIFIEIGFIPDYNIKKIKGMKKKVYIEKKCEMFN